MRRTDGPRILVTGAGGMIGANLCRRLIADGYQVDVMIRGDHLPFRLEPIAGRLRSWRADLLDGEGVAAAIRGAAPDVVVHLASTPFNPPPSPLRHLEVNVLGTGNLLEAVAAARPGARVVFTGSVAQYGEGNDLSESMSERPATVLGASKTAAAALLHAYSRLHGLHTVEIRLFTPYGPWERPGRLVPHVVLSALRGEPVELAGGDQERDFLYVDDAVDALVRALDTPVPPRTVLNICSGAPVPVARLAGTILRLMGDPVPLRTGTRPVRADEIMRMSGDNARAREILGWTPTISLDEGLDRTIRWIKGSLDLIARLA